MHNVSLIFPDSSIILSLKVVEVGGRVLQIVNRVMHALLLGE